MTQSVRLLAFVLTLIVATGCATTAPRYTVNYAAVPDLKAANLSPVKVDETVKPSSPANKSKVESLTIRGGTFSSPYGSFSEFLTVALRSDLDQAGLLNDTATTHVSAVLIRNELDGSGASIGFAEIEAKITVVRNGVLAYEQAKSIRHEWPSSFMGAVAIPRAGENYPFAMKKLLGTFYADPEFLKALK